MLTGRNRAPLVGAVLGALLCAMGATSDAHADFITTNFGTPTADQGSWAYSKIAGVGQGNNPSWQPVISDWAGAAFQGYVHQDSTGLWHTIGAGTHDEDTIYVFKTYVMAEQDMVIPLHFDGDDGHSIYLNDVLLGGGGIGAQVNFNLSLLANVPVKIEFGVYNGPGAMVVELRRAGLELGIDTIPNLYINAEGIFSVVPEPSSLALMLGGVLLPVGATFRRRGSAKKSRA